MLYKALLGHYENSVAFRFVHVYIDISNECSFWRIFDILSDGYIVYTELLITEVVVAFSIVSNI